MALLTLWVSSSDTYSERRFDRSITIASLKDKLELITGVRASSQQLSLSDPGAAGTTRVIDDGGASATLQDYGAQNGMKLSVQNTDPAARGTAGQFTDLSRVEKFEITTEEYEARPDTVRAYKERNKIGRFADQPSSPSFQPPRRPPPLDESFQLGARCQVSFSDEMSRRGVIRFLGETEFRGPGDGSVWVGVEWDEPVGKNDGMVAGKRYFQTGPLRASFVRPDRVTVGDFPELDPFADEEQDTEHTNDNNC